MGDFDTGGHYDGGGSGGSGDSGSSGSRSRDRDRDSYSSSDSDSGSSLTYLFFVLVVAVIAALMFAFEKIRQWVSKAKYRMNMHGMNALKKADPDFDWEDMQKWVRELYTHMQTDWEAGDISDLKPDFLDACWRQLDNQLQSKLSRGYKGHVRNIRFQKIEMLGWCRKETVEYMDIGLRTNIISWNTDKDEKTTTGSKTDPKDMEYLWRLQRPAPGKTAPRIRCAACSRSVPALMSRCPECQTPRDRDPNAWVIYDITGMPSYLMSK